MTLVKKSHLSLTLQTIKKLLSFKADKTDLATKIDRSEVTELNAIKIATKTGLVKPTTAEDGTIYTDENGVVYIL